MVSVAGGRVDAEQDQPGGVAVDAVDRYQIIQAEPVFQAHQQRLVQVFPRRYHRQKMRLVGYQQMGVAVEHGLLQRNRGFRFQRAEIVDARAGAKGCVGGQRFPIRVAHTAAGHALRPHAAVDVDKAGAQKIQQGRPSRVADRGQDHAAGAHALARCGSQAHRRAQTTSQTPWPSLSPRFSNLVSGR